MSSRNPLARFKLGKSQADIDRVLRYIVHEAYRSVPYYTDTWSKGGVQIHRFRGVRDLPQLPVTSRESVNSIPERDRLHRHASINRCVHSSTSGYLGLPLTVHMSRTEALWRKLTLLRVITQYVKAPLPIRLADVGPMVPRHRTGIEQKLRIVKILRIPATAPLVEAAERLRRFRPTIVEGYPTCLELLAEELERQGGSPLRTRLVISRGEVLHNATRNLLARVFSCQVRDMYSCEEGGNMAWECPVNPGLWHVNNDTCVLEVVDDDGLPVPAGTEGRVLLTNLFNRTMPFIRYELGDRATMGTQESCSCNATGVTLTSIAGRDDDFLTSPDGRRLSPRLAANTVFNVLRSDADSSTVSASVAKFQIVQEFSGSICLRVVLRTPEGEKNANRAARALESVMPGSSCRVEVLTEIPLAAGGKLKKVLVERKPKT